MTGMRCLHCYAPMPHHRKNCYASRALHINFYDFGKAAKPKADVDEFAKDFVAQHGETLAKLADE